jgi:hypothetical protein
MNSHFRPKAEVEVVGQRTFNACVEPTLLKDGLVQVIARLKERFPETGVLMLSNGRMYAYEDFVRKLAAVHHPDFLTSIPLTAPSLT